MTAFESGSINNLMLIEIALLDFLVLGRSFSGMQVLAILIVLARSSQCKPDQKRGRVRTGIVQRPVSPGNSLTVMDFVRVRPVGRGRLSLHGFPTGSLRL